MQHNTNAYEEKVGITGVFTFVTLAQHLKEELEAALAESREAYLVLRDMLVRGGYAELSTYHNLVTTVGKSAHAAALYTDLASVGALRLTYQELGTGTTAPSYADTGLQTPLGGSRKAITTMGGTGNVVNVTSLWNVGEATGTLKEYGLFRGGTLVSNSGTLWNRVAIDKVVAADKALTVDGTITFN